MIRWFSAPRDHLSAAKKNALHAAIRDYQAEFQEAILAATGAKAESAIAELQ